MGLASEPVVSADGQALHTKGKCELEISLSGITVVHLLLVAVDVTQDCLLEINFLGKQNCTIDLKGKHSKLAKGLWVSRKKKRVLQSLLHKCGRNRGGPWASQNGVTC